MASSRDSNDKNKNQQQANDESKRLWEASSTGDVATVRALLAKGKADVNWQQDGLTPLHEASSSGHTQVVELLLNAGANVNATNKRGWTPLHAASASGHTQIVEMLLNAGANINATKYNGWTPLHDAISDGRTPVVEMLLNARADTTLGRGWTPLHEASASGRPQLVELLLNAGADVNAKNTHGETALYRAVQRGSSSVVRLLLNAGANVNAKTEWGETPLHRASSSGHTQIVEMLLNADADVNVAYKDGVTPLHKASSSGHTQVAELLLNAGANLNATNKWGETPFHEASTSDRGRRVVELFLKATKNADEHKRLKLLDECLRNSNELYGASFKGDSAKVRAVLAKDNVNVNWQSRSQSGRTPLHTASGSGRVQVVELLLNASAKLNLTDEWGQTPLHKTPNYPDCARLLLRSGADVHARDNDGKAPLHACIEKDSTVTTRTLQTLQVLVSFGATWDTKCDHMVRWGKAQAHKYAPPLRICVLLWTEDHQAGRPFTNIPIEVIKEGAKSTQAYVDNLQMSRHIIFRLKLCLVGCSCAGKTSFVKSIIHKLPQLVHFDDRTIGIDHLPLCFQRLLGDSKVQYEVTFWDFAGQDPYQVAHSLFFSPRTLFFVFIDLEAFTVGFLQASIMSNTKKQEEQLMGEYVERTVMRWIRLILSRQPDAQFAFIATKDDLLAENKVTEKLFKKVLEVKLAEVDAAVGTMRQRQSKDLLDEDASATESGVQASADTPATKTNLIFVSCTSPASVQAARDQVEELIANADRGFQMPDTYTQALDAIVEMRKTANVSDVGTRIQQVFVRVDSLPQALNIEPKLCRVILQTLHDLGDVLWFEDLGVELFEKTVILDPLLLIDFFRQVINHKHTGQIMSHADLKALPFWMSLNNQDQLRAMKQVLQKFHLVYSADEDRVMEWDSDMIVPAYWQTKTPASWLFLGDILRLGDTKTCEGDAVRVDWEFHFEFGLPSTLFDHLVVASVSPIFQFDAGPDWILYKVRGVAACRIMIGRDVKSLHRSIHVEAVVSETANRKQTGRLWATFQHLCEAFVRVLRESPGLVVSSFAWDDNHNKIHLRRLTQLTTPEVSEAWMPPPETWDRFKRLVSTHD